MNKAFLKDAFQKTFLETKGVDEYYIFWNKENGKLTVTSSVVAFKTTIVSRYTVTGLSRLPDSNFVVREPKKLLNVLDILKDNIEFSFKREGFSNKIFLSDGKFNSRFSTVDESVVKNKPHVHDDKLDFDVTIDLSKELIEDYIKAKKANNETELVSISSKDQKILFELGDATSYSNKINFSVELDGVFDMKQTYFSADFLNKIFSLNKGYEGKLFVMEEKILKALFNYKIDNINIKTEYFIAAIDQIL